MKKPLLIFFMTAALIAVGFLLFHQTTPSPEKCAFCDQTVLDYQTFYEDDLVLALYTHKPIFPGHCLVIPRRHVERFEQLTDDEISEMGRVIKKVDQAVMKVFGTRDYLLLQKNGKAAGQTVPHVHIHYVPRSGDGSGGAFVAKTFLVNLGKPIKADEMNASVSQLRDAMLDLSRNSGISR